MCLRLAALQPQEPDATEGLRLLLDAAERGADLAVLPEAFVRPEPPETEDGPAVSALLAAARALGVALVLPVIVLDAAGKPRNRALVFDRTGRRVGHYDKVHCTRVERDGGVVAGDDWPVFDMGGWHLGVLICHDLSFPESARVLRLHGADVLAWPHVQSGWGDVAWEAVLRARAIDQAVPIVTACYGRPPDRAWRPGQMVGRSGVVGADGTILADAGRYPGVVTADVDPEQPLIKHDFSLAGEHPFWPNVLADRRPETYSRLMER